MHTAIDTLALASARRIPAVQGSIFVRWKAWIVASSLCVPFVAQSPAAFAQHAPDGATRARARQNFQTGVAAYQRGDFSVALEAFLTAYRLAPHPTVRVNIANCY